MATNLLSPMPVRVRFEAIPLQAWQCCAQAPGAAADPSSLASDASWFPAVVPGTVASAMQAAGQWDLRRPLDADANDWWYRTTFNTPDISDGQACHLVFDGLATLAEVWLNGVRVLTADNMFRVYRVDVARYLQGSNELSIVFRSLTHDLAARRPRPRWKTNLVQQQQLRWRRTSLLGRIPGWSPPVPPVGPWRPVRLETGDVGLVEKHITTSLDGNVGIVTLRAVLRSTKPLDGVRLHVGDSEIRATVTASETGWNVRAELRVPNAPLWWPHTHGEQPRLDCSIVIGSGDDAIAFSCGKIGFRSLAINEDCGFGVRINGEPIYCRGACWTVADIASLTGDAATLAHDLRLARDAGVNMLRIGGTMVYENDAFYDLCDELGILVWQDFMFANMDYPVDDPAFAANIEAEAVGQLHRLSHHPCVAVYCGNSEIEQQAAMLGMPRELWSNRWFAERLPALCAEHHAGTTYVRSTPSGGVLPFHTAAGVTHYYGIGAYLRSMRELRQADVKFTPECLAFANVPEPDTINEVTGGGLPAVHQPVWKQRVPRDTGAGWDFEDVRDHYLKEFFGVDPVALRCFDMPRYLQLGRVVTGEMMAQVFAEWRGGHSHNQGGLVWFYKDLWPGAGWGIVDSLGRPKAAYYYLRRAWRDRQISLTDEGLDGLHVHVINETAHPLVGSIEVLVLAEGHIKVAQQNVPCSLPPRGRQTLSADEILGGFYDLTYAYRFGPVKHDIVIATLFDRDQKVLSEAVHFVHRREPTLVSDAKVNVHVSEVGDGHRVTVAADRFLQSVCLSASGYLPEDNYFHLMPQRERVIHFRRMSPQPTKFAGFLESLNLKDPIRIAK